MIIDQIPISNITMAWFLLWEGEQEGAMFDVPEKDLRL